MYLMAPVQIDTQTSIYLSTCLTPSLFTKGLTYRHKFMSMATRDISLSLTLFFLNQGLCAILSHRTTLCVHGRPRFSSASQSPLWPHHAGARAICSDSAAQRWGRGEHGGESKRQSKTYVGFEASAWSVCSFSPPSTSMVQYTIRLGASDFRPCTSMMTTCRAKKEESKRSSLLHTSLWLLNPRGQPALGSSTCCWMFMVAGGQGRWHCPG